MGVCNGATENWDRIKEIADKLKSPHADKVYVAKDFTKEDLWKALVDTIPGNNKPVS